MSASSRQRKGKLSDQGAFSEAVLSFYGAERLTDAGPRTKGLSDHCMTVSGWAMTIAALGIAVLGPLWSSCILWVVRCVKRVYGSLFVNPFDYCY
jgi:hypothetical protein